MEDNVKGFPGVPHFKDSDVSAENSVLGALLNSDGHPMDCREPVLEIFAQAQGRVFVHPLNRKIFSAFAQCLIEENSSTPRDVVNVLREEGDLDDEIMERIYDIAGSAGGMVEAEHGAKILYNLYRRRIVATAMEDGARLVRSGEKEANIAITDAFSQVATAVETGDVPDTRFERDRLVEAGLGAILGLRVEEPGISFGFKDLDERYGQMRPAELTAWGARSGGGKTVFAVQVARHAALKQDVPSVIFSLEMTPGNLLQRSAAAELRINYRNIRENKNLTPENVERIRKFADRERNNKNYRIEHMPGATVGELYLKARQAVRDMGAQLFIIDYAQSVNPDVDVKGDEHKKMLLTVPRINEIATKLNVHVILLAQLNKPDKGRDDVPPTLHDISYGGKIENVATNIILSHRIPVEGKPGSEVEFHGGKNRLGTLGVDEATFDGAHQRFLPAGALLSANLEDL